MPVHGGEIIKGEKVPEGEMLFMASVQNVHQHHVCGGFLISEDFVLTAAHCDNNRWKTSSPNVFLDKKYMKYILNHN